MLIILCLLPQDSPFECVHGYQPPLFPALERVVRVPSAAVLIQCCRRTWFKMRQTLLRTSTQYKTMGDQQRTRGCRIKYASGFGFPPNLPLRSEWRKLEKMFPVSKIVHSVSVLKLPRSLGMRLYLIYVKRGMDSHSPLVPGTAALPPPHIIDGKPVYSVNKLLAVHRRGRGRQFLVG